MVNNVYLSVCWKIRGALLTPWFQTCCIWNCERINLCCYKPPACGMCCGSLRKPTSAYVSCSGFSVFNVYLSNPWKDIHGYMDILDKCLGLLAIKGILNFKWPQSKDICQQNALNVPGQFWGQIICPNCSKSLLRNYTPKVGYHYHSAYFELV